MVLRTMCARACLHVWEKLPCAGPDGNLPIVFYPPYRILTKFSKCYNHAGLIVFVLYHMSPIRAH